MATKTFPPGAVLMRPMLDGLARKLVAHPLARRVCDHLRLAHPRMAGIDAFTLVLFYGVFALFDGGLAIGAAIMGDTPSPRWWLALVGVLGILTGALTLFWPHVTGFVLLFFIAGWSIAAGIFDIVGAVRLRRKSTTSGCSSAAACSQSPSASSCWPSRMPGL